MKKNIWRLVTALIISSAGFFGTVIWFNSNKHDARAGDRLPVARLSDSTNEVQRKPVQRVIWESVNRNDELYPGEAVRTAPNADARLFFLKSGTIVHLEPDSLVVLEENDKGLSLDFLQGNLFVQSNNTSDGKADGLTLKTGSGEIKLKSADMSLSKGTNGNVNLEVHRGEAQLAQGGKSTALNKENSAVLTANGVSVANDRVQMLKPQAGETLYLNLTKGETVDLAWKPLPAGYHIAVEVGAQRRSLAPLANLTTEGIKGQISFAQKPGHWYLRLVATSADSKQVPMSSTVIPFTVEPKSPPSLVEPHQDASILKSAPDAATMFKWANRHKFQSQVLEIATEPTFKMIKAHEVLAGDITNLSNKLEDGSYFWRVTGYLKIKDKTESLTSTPGKFSLVSKIDIKPPLLISPANDVHLSFVDVQKDGVQLKWQTAKGVDGYKVTLEHKVDQSWKPVQSQSSETTQMRFTDLPAGPYRWSVASVDPKDGGFKPSAPFVFTIEELQKIEWVDENPKEYEFHTPTPSFVAHWKPLNTPPAIYRYKIMKEGGNLADETWHTTRQTVFDLSLPEEGKYQTIVEAVNAKGQMYAQSNLRTVDVKRRPLLPAPQWTSNTPPVMKSDGKGNLTLGWEQVQGAEHYLMILESADGKVLDQREISRTTASFSRLKPGQYQVHLKSVDDFKRPGLQGDRRKIEVPTASDIRAPKIKAMKVN